MNSPPGLQLVNPLPKALGHYETSLIQILTGAGVSVHRIDSPASEMASGGVHQKLRRSLDIAKWRRDVTSLDSGSDVLAIWPAFANLDPLTWRGDSRTALIWHDPKPLRPTLGSGRFLAALGSMAQRRKQISIFVHTERARVDLEELGFSVSATVPHPFAVREGLAPQRVPERRVVVAGQYKPARDMALIGELGWRLRKAGYRPLIVGRGWPKMEGWDVDSRFLPEAELDNVLASATAVLLPYAHVYQSGIAIRAAEIGVPVVGYASTNVSEVYGPDWIGLVPEQGSTAQDWITVIDRTAGLDAHLVSERLSRWRSSVRAAWAELARNLGWDQR